MAGEIWLALAAACVACAAWRGVRYARRLRYEPQHTAEQPAIEHEGVTETSPRLVDLPLAPPPPPIDPRVLLAEAEGELIRAQRRVEELRDAVRMRDEQRFHIALDAMERSFRDKLSRTGRAVHLEANTAEFRRSDIRRIVRSGAPR